MPVRKVSGGVRRPVLPAWARRMKELFRSGTVAQFILSGNILDPVPWPDASGKIQYLSLPAFLTNVLFQPFESVLFYNRGRGLTVARGDDGFHRYRQAMAGAGRERVFGLSKPAAGTGARYSFPNDRAALDVIGGFLSDVASPSGPGVSGVSSAAVVIERAEFLAPRGDLIHVGGELGQLLLKMLDWAGNPAVLNAQVITVLLAENVSDLNRRLADNPLAERITIPYPTPAELSDLVTHLQHDIPDFKRYCRLSPAVSGRLLAGLNRNNTRRLILTAVRNQKKLTPEYIARVKKERIEREAYGKLEFIEPRFTLDDMAGHEEARRWLKADARLIRRGIRRSIPKGYLITGRIGVGKTFLAECFAGECGIPFVVMRNFREKWVGATEGNLEKIFAILEALGRVLVFVDEADQITGRRSAGSGDSGLSGRIYGMLAAEMARPETRGRIIWMFATSRPDYLEVDLKRQGRLDVHIPLFPTSDPNVQAAILMRLAKRMDVRLRRSDLENLGNLGDVVPGDLEGLLVRAIRRWELQPETGRRRSLAWFLKQAVETFKPPLNQDELRLMDELAVRECTDRELLPADRAKHPSPP